MAHPKAHRISQNDKATTWRVDWPSTMTKQGKQYIAVTLPSGELAFILTAAKRRAVAKAVHARIEFDVLAAIATASASA